MIGAIIQARMGSSRLPGKSLADLAGQPMLARVYNRIQRAASIEKVIIATSDRPRDDPIATLAHHSGWSCFRGSEMDCLDRYYQAARQHGIDPIVRVTGDCPFVDPGVIDLVVNTFLESRYIFVANRLPPPWKRTYPLGLDVEVCSFAGLAYAWKHATKPYEREHVMPYLYTRNHISFYILDLPTDLSRHRWTVDTPADLAFARAVYAHFGNVHFDWRELLAYLKQHPEVERINAHVEQAILPVV